MNRFFEVADEVERISAFERYIKSLADLTAKYQVTIHPKYIEHERQSFLTMPIGDLRRRMLELPNFLRDREQDMARQQRETLAKQKREQESLRIDGEQYYRAEDKYERVVCKSRNPGFDKTGMDAYPMKDLGLDGYYGIHVGGGWLGILKRDGYCDGDAYHYVIHADEMIEDGIEIYQMVDPHVYYKDVATPDSWIIFSEYPKIPAKYIELEKITPEEQIEESPPPYGM